MTTNPKLEFYRFTLNHKTEKFKTFKDFAIEELNKNEDLTDEDAFKSCFYHFIKSLEGRDAKNSKMQKQITFVRNKDVNEHFDKEPSMKSERNIIHGVINGGPYGKKRILSNVNNSEDTSKLERNKSVLLYYYFLLYLPTDHNEGFFMIHSNSIEESITSVFKSFIAGIFTGATYNVPQCETFSPKSFQEEYKKGAVIKSIKFKYSYLNDIPSIDGISNDFQDYEIKIQAVPKNKKISIAYCNEFKNFFIKKIFGNQDEPKKLGEFDAAIEVKNPVDKSIKTFEFDTRDESFVPVVYLKERIKMNEDGTPDFEELKQLCIRYCEDEILPELRPDLNAVSVM